MKARTCILLLIVPLFCPVLLHGECLMSHNTRCNKTDPDVYRNVSQLIESRGFPVENHHVITKDGFILSIQRIPYGRQRPHSVGKKPVVFLQHGLLADASCWVMQWEYNALGYILADHGFDVWLGNIRGNRYSRQHVKYTPFDREFWDWSWEEMADYDIPAMIDYVLQVTQATQLHYIGHSQGTLVGFLSFSEWPEIAKKVKQFIALAPIYHLNHTEKLVRDAAYLLGPIQELFFPLGPTPFLPGVATRELVKLGVCGGKYSEKACFHVVEVLFGFDDEDTNMTRVPVFLAHWPSGTSFKNVIHFCQDVYFGHTRRFDYGEIGNLIRYGTKVPPSYNVSKMNTPTALFLGLNDSLSVEADVDPLSVEIPNLVLYEKIPDWNHIDFVMGIDAPKLLYNEILKLIRSTL